MPPPPPASAGTLSLTFTGTVTSDSDLTGEFGPAGGSGNLFGDAYTARFVFDAPEGYVYGSIGQFIVGGVAYSTMSPIVSASVTVNGHTHSLAGNYFGGTSYQNGGDQYTNASDQNEYEIDDYESYSFADSSSVWLYNYYPLISTNITGSFTVFTKLSDISDAATFLDESFNYELGSEGNLGTTFFTDTEVSADITGVTVSSGVPEPGTWALMALGFVSLGFVAYRKRKLGQSALV